MSIMIKEVFEEHRSKLIGLAYRITGSRSDAEDIVNDAFLKWLSTDHDEIQSNKAWLMKVTTRLSLDYLKSARVQRESYVGPWLPEPFVDVSEMPDNQYEIDESISMALMILLESLSAGERASYILHDLFNYKFNEISSILQKTEPSCRKLASRAREKIQDNVPNNITNKDEYTKIASAFFGAIKNGDTANLINLLKENVAFYTDSGGKVSASLDVLNGADTVALFLMEKVRPALAEIDSNKAKVECLWFNGVPGFIIKTNDKPVTAFNFVIEDNVISRIYVHRNPSKLSLFYTPLENNQAKEHNVLFN